jgi:hypothetical protein
MRGERIVGTRHQTKRLRRIFDDPWPQQNRARHETRTGGLLCRGRIVLADWFFPSPRIGGCCGAITGAKGREEINVERWICSECGTEH